MQISQVNITLHQIKNSTERVFCEIFEFFHNSHVAFVFDLCFCCTFATTHTTYDIIHVTTWGMFPSPLFSSISQTYWFPCDKFYCKSEEVNQESSVKASLIPFTSIHLKYDVLLQVSKLKKSSQYKMFVSLVVTIILCSLWFRV